MPAFAIKIENGHVFIDLNSGTARTHKKREPHSLARPSERAPGPVRVVSVSTTAMDSAYPRRSTSERLLEIRLKKRARC